MKFCSTDASCSNASLASDTLKSLAKQVEEELVVEDCEFKQYPFGKEAVLFVYAKVASPDFLNTLYFAEVRHGARLLIHLPKYQMLAVAGAGSSAGSEGWAISDR